MTRIGVGTLVVGCSLSGIPNINSDANSNLTRAIGSLVVINIQSGESSIIIISKWHHTWLQSTAGSVMRHYCHRSTQTYGTFRNHRIDDALECP